MKSFILFLIAIFLFTCLLHSSLSWEAGRFSASQDILRILLSPKVHYRIHGFPPPGPILSYQRISPGLRTLWMVRNKIRFYGEELLAPRRNLKLKDHPLSGVRHWYFYIFAGILHIGCRYAIRNLRTLYPLWQEPTYHRYFLHFLMDIWTCVSALMELSFVQSNCQPVYV